MKKIFLSLLHRFPWYLWGVAILALSCKESLPTYVEPTHVLAASVETVEQLSDRLAPPGHQIIRIKIDIENVYDEVFYDTINIGGTMNISWTRKPGRTREMTLDEKNFLNRDLIKNRKLMLLPGEHVALQFYWNLKGNDSAYFPDEMDYVRMDLRDCGSYNGYTVSCSNEEDMIVEGDISLFKNLDSVHVEAFPFFATGRIITIPGP